ncbi:peptide-N(4)-(N-acetyl-beta-glucosaminyl)asparagine amidase-like [Mytilus edulis]|uniref:peptide-N(4)-(N-acetyl-beta- glucosaminyl)asparagine amidase-like n=1 Tax=Mytilus edulis TaxID=6550 RepID=UPI0039EE2392
MAPTPSSIISLSTENPKDDFVQAAKIILKFADNILSNPNEEKYRKIRLGNPTVETKLLPIVGALECIFEMGFQEDGEYLTLPRTSPISQVKTIRDSLIQEIQKVSPVSVNGPQAAGGSVQPTRSISQPKPSTSAILPNYQQLERQFFQKIESNLSHVLKYENQGLQAKARHVIPTQHLIEKAQKSFQALAQSGNVGDIGIRDCLILELLAWFKNSFFKWVDAPPCDTCGGKPTSVGMATPTADDTRWGAGRVENYKCEKCQKFIRFPRYNSPEKLLETRCGRCGEWANCFTLCCRAMGFEARYVLDWTDHVWTEVYSPSQKRWLHCDPCENICDKPLLYESGWGKQLTYVLAFSADEVQDVSWRYSSKHSELLTRRRECRETWLVQVLHKLWNGKLSSVTDTRKQEMVNRLLTELVEFITPKSTEGQNLSGRTTGSLAWRQARGEVGTASAESKPEYVFNLTEDEKKSKTFHIRYSCAKDEYVRMSDLDADKVEGFSSCLFKCEEMFRKEEQDWKMVYLARKEGSSKSSLTWKFDFKGLKISKLEVRISSAVYEDGVISWLLCSDSTCAMLKGSNEFQTVHDLEGEDGMTITADLSGGKGDNAWQHTQLFRQSNTDLEFCPFEVKVHFA